MFSRIKKVVTDWIMETKANANIGRSYKSVFELDGVNEAYSQFYNFGILIWKALYKGFYSAWHIVPAPTIKNPKATRNLAYLNIAKAITSELAGNIWTDQAKVSVSSKALGENEVDPLNEFIQDVLYKNNFAIKMTEAIEQASALGGEALKVWCEFKKDDEGNAIEGTEEVKIGYSMADQFVPTAWTNAEITEGFFISRIAKNNYYYTKIEWHRWNGDTYIIDNELYRAEINNGGKESQDILGYRYPLALLYPNLEEHVELAGFDKSLFSYFKPPMANNLDDNSPLGISIYANAMETLHALDICFDSFCREFVLGRKRIIVPAAAIRTVADPVTGEMIRYFDATDEVYEALSVNNPEDFKIQDNSVSLRVEEHVKAMNAFLNTLCLQTGLSFGTFSFDAGGGIKTATEVVSENSKTYKTIKTFQNNIKPAIERLVENIISIAVLYDITWNGQSIADMVKGGYEIAVSMDDGITQDRQTNINEGMTLVGAKLMSKFKFLTDSKYGQGLTPEEAQQELERIANEGKVNIDVFDSAEAFSAE